MPSELIGTGRIIGRGQTLLTGISLATDMPGKRNRPIIPLNRITVEKCKSDMENPPRATSGLAERRGQFYPSHMRTNPLPLIVAISLTLTLGAFGDDSVVLKADNPAPMSGH